MWGTVERNSSPFLYLPWTSPVMLLSVIFSTLPSLTSRTKTEKSGCAPVGLVFLITAKTRPTRPSTITHKTRFLTLEFMRSPQMIPATSCLYCTDEDNRGPKGSTVRRLSFPNPQHRARLAARGKFRRGSELSGPHDLVSITDNRPGRTLARRARAPSGTFP